MKFFKYFWSYFIKIIKFPRENRITFIHKNPKIFNIGDYLCSPRHYFKFKDPIKNLTIVGGGVFSNLAFDLLMKYNIDINKSVLWAVGNSKKDFLGNTEEVSNLPFLQWGIRDIECVSYDHFLPCVSCMHPMLDQCILGSETLLFLNKNPKVISSEYVKSYKSLAKDRNWDILFNNCTAQEISQALSNYKHIITNSYHGAYWGLLSGHKVTLLGHNTKFVSLLKIFGFDNSQLIRFKKGDGLTLIDCLQSIIDDSRSVELIDHKSTLNNFRKINLDFAESLKDKCIIKDYELKSLMQIQ